MRRPARRRLERHRRDRPVNFPNFGPGQFVVPARPSARKRGRQVVSAYVHGIYPRSEALVAATRDLDRGRTSPEAVDAQVDRDLEELISVQQAAGLDLLTDGMLRWQDLFRPLVEAADG